MNSFTPFLPFLLSFLAFSPQFSLLSQCSISFFVDVNKSSSQCPHDQQSALLQLQHDLSKDPNGHSSYSSSKFSSWKQATDCCSWNGVTCDKATGNVIGLDVTFDLPEFSHDSASQLLNLGKNSFSKVLLHSFNNLRFLKVLRLGNCSLSGLLPSSILNLTQLEYLDLSFNNFSGPIPSSLGERLQRLTYLNLYSNSLEGSIPSSLFSHPSLWYMDLGGNQLNHWPNDFFNNASSLLTIVYLDDNKFQGPIPGSVWKLQALQTLDLSYNNFSATIDLAEMFQNLKNLSELQLSGNKITVLHGDGNDHLISPSQIHLLALSSCNITEFPNILKNQNQVRYLDLSNNKISGEIPNWIWMVGNGTLSHLNLSNNFLESLQLPLPVLSLNSLQVVDLHSNKLRGSLPVLPPLVYFQDYSNNSFTSGLDMIDFTFMKFFFLSGNKVSGEIPPTSICNAHFIEVLDLSRNNFSGSIPECPSGIGNSIKILNLQKNSLQGIVPQNFEEGCSLMSLNLCENQLEGPLPRSLTNCTKLVVLDIGNNYINDSFPFWLEDLSSLHILILKSNKFHGPITRSQTDQLSFHFLRIFDLSINFFVGELPRNFFSNMTAMMRGNASDFDSNDQFVMYKLQQAGIYYQDTLEITLKRLQLEYGRILTKMFILDLSKNRFQGEIPMSIGDLKLLGGLNLSQNGFSGGIPISLQYLIQLQSLDLSQNKLSGEIPRQLIDLTFLEVLNLSQNFLSGTIPQSFQFLTFTNDSFLGNEGLCGPPLSRQCGAEITSPSAFSVHSLGLREIDRGVMRIGFGLGFGVGLGAILWTLVLWRDCRIRYAQLIDAMLLMILVRSSIFLRKFSFRTSNELKM